MNCIRCYEEAGTGRPHNELNTPDDTSLYFPLSPVFQVIPDRCDYGPIKMAVGVNLAVFLCLG